MTRFKLTHSGKLKPVLLIAIFLIFGAIIWIYFQSRSQDSKEGNKSLFSFPKASLSIGKLTHTATRDGKTEWTLEAGSGQYLDENKTATIKDLMIAFYLDDGTITYLKADEGILNSQTNDIAVSGHIAIENKGYRLVTEKINYNHEKRIVYSDTPITIENDYLYLTADRLKLDLIENKTYLSGNVKGHLNEHKKN